MRRHSFCARSVDPCVLRTGSRFAERLERRTLLAGTPAILKDLNLAGATGNDEITDRAVIGSTLFFTANDGSHGPELWKSDGTPAGTSLVKDIFAGTTGSNPRNLTIVGNKLFFIASDGVSGSELWISDGTAPGTNLVKDIVAGTGNPALAQLTSLNGKLLFRANDGVNGAELWISDGTQPGTTLLKDIRIGASSSTPDNLRVIDTIGYFSANDGATGIELWRSDGTAAGTSLVRDIRSGGNSSSPAQLTNVNGTLFFAALTASTGIELYKSDGTNAGTVLVKDILPGSASSGLANLTDVNGELFFSARDVTAGNIGDQGVELWKSDGTDVGTVQIADIAAGAASSNPASFFANPPSFGGGVYIAADDLTHGNEIWYSDGTSAGTHLVTDIVPGTGSSNPSSFFADPGGFGGGVFVAASDVDHGTEIWVTNGTIAGTHLVKDVKVGTASSTPSFFTLLGEKIYFKADGDETGNAFWATNGTAAGTLPAIDVNPKTLGSSPADYAGVGTSIFFAANALGTGRELYKTDGTPNGTQLVRDIVPGPGSSNPTLIVDLAGTAYFLVQGGELWRSSGTAATTTLVKTNVANTRPAVFQGKVYFIYNDPASGFALCRTDNSGATTQVADIRADSAPGDLAPDDLTTMDNGFFFVATNPNGREVWVSDGTPTGTHILSDIAPGAASSDPHDLTTAAGVLWFVANDTVHGAELWRSDGTLAHTVMAADLNAGSGSSAISNLTALSVGTFFTAGTTTYRTAGLAGAVTPLASVQGSNFVSFGGKVFFSGLSSGIDYELWSTDGTPAGTSQFVDLVAGPTGSFPIELTPLGNLMYFRAYQPATGSELFQTDGTPAGTVLVLDILAGPNSSATNSSIFAFNDHLLFSADDGTTGEEPWDLSTPAEISWTGAGGDGNWHNPQNWSGGVVPGPDDHVIIDLPNAQVTIFSTTTVSSLALYDASLTLQAPFLVNDFSVVGGRMEGTDLDVTNMSVTGAAATIFNLRLKVSGTMSLSSGAHAQFASGLTSANKTPTMHNLTLSSNSQLDVRNNRIWVDYASTDPNPIGSLQASTTSGYAGGMWTGNGIMSSIAQTTPNRAVGLANSASLFNSFPVISGGATIDSTGVLIGYTFSGDANLDGAVNFTDLLITAQNYGGLSGKTWITGDFTYDGKTEFVDLLAVAQNFGAASPPLRNASRRASIEFVFD